jgi:hypothetical protein
LCEHTGDVGLNCFWNSANNDP